MALSTGVHAGLGIGAVALLIEDALGAPRKPAVEERETEAPEHRDDDSEDNEQGDPQK